MHHSYSDVSSKGIEHVSALPLQEVSAYSGPEHFMESSRALYGVTMRSGLDCQVWMCATTEIPIRLCLAISETATTTLPASEFATAAEAATVVTPGTHRKMYCAYGPRT